jgi:hypothetical protein
MGTHTTTTQSNQYAPGAMNNYQNWMGQLSPMLTQMMNNPFGSPSFNMNLQQSTKAANLLGQRGIQNAMQNFGGQGLGTTGGAFSSLLQKAGQYGSNLQQQGFNTAFNQAQTNQWNAASLGTQAFGNPLVTGGTSTQSTGGLGTWLPQVLGGGLSALIGASMGGGAGVSQGAMNSAISGLPTSTGGSGGYGQFFNPMGSYGSSGTTPSPFTSPFSSIKF